MGYYTQFEIEADGFKDKMEAEFFNFRLNKISNYYFNASVGDGVLIIETDDIKWYDWEKDLITISKEFPHVLIEVNGSGESTGDIWHARFRNGESEVHHAKMNLPPFKRILRDE